METGKNKLAALSEFTVTERKPEPAVGFELNVEHMAMPSVAEDAVAATTLAEKQVMEKWLISNTEPVVGFKNPIKRGFYAGYTPLGIPPVSAAETVKMAFHPKLRQSVQLILTDPKDATKVVESLLIDDVGHPVFDEFNRAGAPFTGKLVFDKMQPPSEDAMFVSASTKIVPAEDFMVMPNDKISELFSNNASVIITFDAVTDANGAWVPTFDSCGAIVDSYFNGAKKLRRDGAVVNRTDAELSQYFRRTTGTEDCARDLSFCFPEDPSSPLYSGDNTRHMREGLERFRSSIKNGSFNRAKPTAKGWPGAVAGAEIQSGQFVKMVDGVATPVDKLAEGANYDTEARPSAGSVRLVTLSRIKAVFADSVGVKVKVPSEAIDSRYQSLTNAKLLNEDLLCVDPFDPTLSAETKLAIYQECMQNPWYFFTVVQKLYPLKSPLVAIDEAFKQWTKETIYEGTKKS